MPEGSQRSTDSQPSGSCSELRARQLAKRLEERLQVELAVVECRLGEHQAAGQRVGVAVVDSGHERAAAKVDHLGRRARRTAPAPAVRAHVGDASALTATASAIRLPATVRTRPLRKTVSATPALPARAAAGPDRAAPAASPAPPRTKRRPADITGGGPRIGPAPPWCAPPRGPPRAARPGSAPRSRPRCRRSPPRAGARPARPRPAPRAAPSAKPWSRSSSNTSVPSSAGCWSRCDSSSSGWGRRAASASSRRFRSRASSSRA